MCLPISLVLSYVLFSPSLGVVSSFNSMLSCFGVSRVRVDGGGCEVFSLQSKYFFFFLLGKSYRVSASKTLETRLTLQL